MYFGYLGYKYTMKLYAIGCNWGPLCAFYIRSDVVFIANTPLGPSRDQVKTANKNKQICLIYFGFLSLQRCKVVVSYQYLVLVR